MLPLKLRSFVFALLIASTSIAVNAQGVADPGIKDPSKFDRKRPLAQELQASVHNGFRLVAVGDCVISRPLSQYASREPGFAQSIRILEEGDATYGNLETSIIDMRSFAGAPYTGVDDVPLAAEPSVARTRYNRSRSRRTAETSTANQTAMCSREARLASCADQGRLLWRPGRGQNHFR